MTPIEIKLKIAGASAVEAGMRSIGELLDKVGASANQAAPALRGVGESLDKAGASAKQAPALRGVGESLDKVGISAKQTAAALRGVPAQVTDIIVSLQGGQAPLTVFLQQGGQLKDMFGGAGAAAKALGGYVLGMVNPVTVAAAAVGGFYLASESAGKTVRALNSALLDANGRIPQTANELRGMADALASSGFSRGSAAEVVKSLSANLVVANLDLQRFSQSALDLERYAGRSFDDTAKTLQKLTDEPAKTAAAMHLLTSSQYELAKSLEAAGDKSGAAKIALGAYGDEADRVVSGYKASLGKLDTALAFYTDMGTKMWNALTGATMGNTGEQRIAKIKAELFALHSGAPLKNAGFVDSLVGAFDPDGVKRRLIAEKELELAYMLRVTQATEGNAKAEAERQRIQRAGISAIDAVTTAQDKGLSKQQQMNKALDAYSLKIKDLRATNPNSKLLEPLAIARGESAIRDQFKDSGGASAAKAEQTAYDTLIASIKTKIAQNEEELRFSGRLNDADKLRLKMQAELETGARKLTAAHKANALVLLEQLDAQEREKTAVKLSVAAYLEQVQIQEELAADYAAQSKAREAGSKAVSGYMLGIEEVNEALRFELSLMGMSEQSRSTALAQYRIELDLQKQIAAVKANSGFDQGQRDVEIARLESAGAAAKAGASSKAFLDEWQQSVKQYDDIFRQGFAGMLNHGEDGWQSFTKSLATTFKTTVADAIYKSFAQPFVVQVVGQLMGMTGGGVGAISSALPGGAGNVAGANNALSALSGLQSAYKVFTGGLTSSIAGAIGKVGSTIGSSAATSFAAGMKGAALAPGLAGPTTAGASGAMGAGSAAAGAIPVVGWIAAGMMAASSAYKQGYSADDLKWGNPIGLVEKSVTKTLTAIGVNDKLANILTGASLTAKILSWGAGTSHMGAGAIYSKASGLQEGAGIYDGSTFGMGVADEYNAAGQAMASGIAQALSGTLDSVAKTFGKTAGYEVATAFADDSSKDGAWGSLIIKQMGNAVLDWGSTRTSKWAPKEFANGEDGQKEYLAAIAKDTRQVLLDMDLPSWADSILTSLGDVADMDRLTEAIQEIGAVQSTFVQLGQTISVFTGMADSTFEALMKASGGLGALTANAGAYYEAFYSETERLAQSQKSIASALRSVNAEMPRAKDEFRLMVEALDLSTEAGREAYVTMMQVAPAFAAVADAVAVAAAKLAQETATKLLEAFSGRQQLIPLLDATLDRFDALGAGLNGAVSSVLNMGNATGWINTQLGNTSSGLLFFGDLVQGLGGDMTGAQLASAELSGQILNLKLNAGRTVTDIAGLSAALANVNTETFLATMQGVLARLGSMFSDVLNSISDERVAVREAALQIINPTVMSKGQILSGIAGSNVGMPSNARLVAAQNAMGPAYTALDSAKQGQAYWGGAANTAAANVSAAQTSLNSLNQWFSGVQSSFDQFAAYRDWAWSGAGTYSESMALVPENQRRTGQYNQDLASYNAQNGALSNSLSTNQSAYSTAQQWLQTYNAAAAVQQGKVAAAEAESKTAQLAYIDSLQNYAIDAGKAAARLGQLREETIKYYESQKALADLMSQSAGTLRQTVADYRYGQLSPEEQFRSLEGQFNTAYAMALSTSGETLAGYADQMSGLLGPMLDKMSEAGYDGNASAIASYLARAESVAGRVESQTPTNYAADSLDMLGQIDGTLAALEAGSKSAERIIADAINVGRDQTVNGLRQVTNALTGRAVSYFADGGAFTNGVVTRPTAFNTGVMGEAGPEGILPLANVGGRLGVFSAGGDSTAMLQELRAVRRAHERVLQDNANMRIELRAIATSTAKTARSLDRMDADGLLVRTDADTPLATVPA